MPSESLGEAMWPCVPLKDWAGNGSLAPWGSSGEGQAQACEGKGPSLSSSFLNCCSPREQTNIKHFPVAPFGADLVLWIAVNFVLLTLALAPFPCLTRFRIFPISLVCSFSSHCLTFINNCRSFIPILQPCLTPIIPVTSFPPDFK